MSLFERESLVVAPGAFYVPSWLSLQEQERLLESCREWGRGPAGFHVPRMFDGKPLSIKSLYQGWYWRHGGGYTHVVDEAAGTLVKPFPAELFELAHKAYAETFGAADDFEPDSSIINWYDAEATLGMHQDRGETDAVIVRGSPVITVSLGDTGIFRFGNTETRNKPYRDIELQSGDLFVFGGPSRMAYHGVTRILPGTSPLALGLRGRLSITIRESGLGRKP
ncbi:MAG TPA: alpha-ketoglutarate-dependent dioxygenase AlkB [Paucimonas sp.]|nr:alpha-ketoglutarate-dependent dioxygenase AlkB [Paucimonas sp.]